MPPSDNSILPQRIFRWRVQGAGASLEKDGQEFYLSCHLIKATALFSFLVKSAAFPRLIFWVSGHLAFKKTKTVQAIAADQLAQIINIMHINISRSQGSIIPPPLQNAQACQRSKMQSISLWGMSSPRGSRDEKTKSGWMMKRGGWYFTSFFLFVCFFFCLNVAAAPLNPVWHFLIIWNLSARIQGKNGWMGETHERRRSWRKESVPISWFFSWKQQVFLSNEWMCSTWFPFLSWFIFHLIYIGNPKARINEFKW